jgi:hypothetical protein
MNMSDNANDGFGVDFENLGPVTERKTPSQTDPRCGFFPDMTVEEYFADPIEEGSLSNSGIKILLADTPLEFAWQHPRLNPAAQPTIVADTAAGRRGDIVHQLALGKGRGYAVGDFKAWQSNEAKAFRDNAIEAGLTPIKRADFEEAEVMAEVVKEKIRVALDGADYMTEVPIVWKEPVGGAGQYIYLRGMLDVWCPERLIILDPKITDRISNGPPGKFALQNHLVEMGYDRQASLYMRGIEQLMPEAENRVRFENLLVRPKEPFVARRISYDRTFLRTAIFECREAFRTFAECQKRGVWPGYPEEAELVAMPPWIENRRLARELQEDEV